MSNELAANSPTIVVVLGGTGDLMSRKIGPAFFHLFEKNKLPSRFSVVGFSRRDIQDQGWRAMVQEGVEKHLDPEIRVPAEFYKLFSYQKGNFDDPGSYQQLAAKLQAIADQWKVCVNKIFYLAVPPRFYASIFGQLADSGLMKACGGPDGWSRLVVEKPFGKSLSEARDLDRQLDKLFKEEQIYRVDHYLAKEMLQNILLFRFANNLLEDVWNDRHVDRIEVKLLERLGVETRGAFYDGVGALLDVGQNHLLQMLALVTMDHPGEMSAEKIRDRRSEILDALKPLTSEEVESSTIRGQYKGYVDEAGVGDNSTTETYFKIKATLGSSRWSDLPIFLESGKKMASNQKEVAVIFKHPAPCFCPPGKHYTNSIHFRLEPDPGITITFWAKKQGTKMGLERQVLDFKYEDQSLAHTYEEAYPTLLLDCIAGDQTLFLSSRETMAGWEFIDPVINTWHSDDKPMHVYDQGGEMAKLAERVERSPHIDKLKQAGVGVVGLGKMGGNIARQLFEKEWRVFGYNRRPAPTKELEAEGVLGTYSIEELVAQLKPPRLVWLMVPAGAPVDEVIFGDTGLAKYLHPGDIIIDGGNSFYKDAIKRSDKLRELGIRFLDVGVSGGPSGALSGACLMVGGDEDLFDQIRPLFYDIAAKDSFQFFPGAGAGHFVKMVHNGIEYGMMQAIAEGFTVLKKSEYDLNLSDVAHVFNQNSVIESRLIGWLKSAFDFHGQQLEGVSGEVGHTGEAAWTVQAAQELDVPEKIIEGSLNFRVESKEHPSYTGQILTALRGQFGGHALKVKK